MTIKLSWLDRLIIKIALAKSVARGNVSQTECATTELMAAFVAINEACTSQSIVLDALLSAEHELVTIEGLVATDRPDIPLSDETSWTINPGQALAKIRAAISLLSDNGSEA